MSSSNILVRRRLTVGAGVLVLLLAVFTVVARANPGNLILLGRIGRWTLAAALFLGPLVVAGFVLLYVRERAISITVTVLCAVLSVVLFGCSGFAWLLTPSHERTVVAWSSDLRYQVVIDKSDEGLSEHQWVRVVRPAGLNTRESAQPLLCARAEFQDPPPMQYSSVAFTGAHEVELTLTDGSRHRIGFHPSTVEPEYTLDIWCYLDGPRVRTLA
ncbi:hypothetical protein [Dactylosporangium sp. CA-233914]|uniref:hypothetical protein n=1 Tax=Dactylosporangium sp. CA-233914 TaxID=3239934 RepID=UPI003D9138BD